MTSQAFDRFYRAFFEDSFSAWHDGLDLASIRDLSPEERIEAERRLLEALPSGDWRIPAGLAELQSSSANPEFKTRIIKAQGRVRINMAMALWDSEQWPDAPDHVADELLRGVNWGDRIDAARAMRRFGAQADQAALWQAIEHDETDLVRYHALHSLLIALGLHPDDGSTHPLAVQIMHTDPALRAAAVDALRKLIGTA